MCHFLYKVCVFHHETMKFFKYAWLSLVSRCSNALHYSVVRIVVARKFMERTDTLHRVSVTVCLSARRVFKGNSSQRACSLIATRGVRLSWLRVEGLVHAMFMYMPARWVKIDVDLVTFAHELRKNRHGP